MELWCCKLCTPSEQAEQALQERAARQDHEERHLVLPVPQRTFCFDASTSLVVDIHATCEVNEQDGAVELFRKQNCGAWCSHAGLAEHMGFADLDIMLQL
jgi:hypothetical protein